MQAVAGGLRQADETAARFNEAELYRLKGELLPLGAGPQPDDAERCFRQALDIARRQLAEIYGWFTEGFDTADLKEARTLLEALANA